MQLLEMSLPNLKLRLIVVMLLASIMQVGKCQFSDPNRIYIESRKYSAISGKEQLIKVSPTRMQYQVPYARAFASKPDIGLSIYNLQFDYNPQFSINVVQENSNNNQFEFYLVGRPSQSNIFNELFVMYIASDYEQLGIYMPGPRNTTAKLGIPPRENQVSFQEKSQDFTFNFKNIGTLPIFPSTTDENNIRVSVYLTGMTAFFESDKNGYSRNYANFQLNVANKNSRFYTIRVTKKSPSGDILIKVIEFTVVYFDIKKMEAEYQMNSSSIAATNFGGTFFASSYSAPLDALPQNNKFENTLQYFFGISAIECSSGQTINLLAVERFNYNSNGKLQNLLLTFETEGNTYIQRGVFHYIQYKPRTCNDSASCGIPCNQLTIPNYRITNSENRCAPCLYFCASCDNGFNCTTCPVTRVTTNNGICVCSSNSYFDRPPIRECQSCFDVKFCKTCEREGVCLNCFQQAKFTFNNQLRTCECAAGTYDSVGPTNETSLLSRIQSICLPCPPSCVYCRSATSCQACAVPTYLAQSSKEIRGVVQTCSPICKDDQQFTPERTCESYVGDRSLFDSAGRLGFDWEYRNSNNDLVVDLLFSQSNMTYYFYENGKGYQYVTTTTEQTQRNDAGEASVYYDDGNGYINGYTGAGTTSFESSVINTKVIQDVNGYMFDDSAMRGQYYGLGEAKFYQERYKSLQPQAQYLDQFGIPFGKHQLNSTTISDSANFLDAIRNNLEFVVDGQSLPYTIKALSGNHFQLTVRPQKSYLTSNASLVFKNPALVRSDETALQTPIVSKQLDRIDYYTQNQLLTATSLRDRTSTIVQILWGICKYALFTGFGWVVMPLMLILQYIFGYNYITSQLPLNLKYFLTSFADFRNPSILFNPQRNQFDRMVINHPQIYKRVGAYEEFDRGIDFMKNSFQFFFVPLLSFGLQFLLIGINLFVQKRCHREIPIISRYLQPRLGLHAAAYTLVQALPISFFFFGQLQDTRYNHVNSPNSVYPSFNTGMSYASFFASAIIPLIVLTGIYNYFKNKARSGNFDFDKVKGSPNNFGTTTNDPAMIADPLWGGNPLKASSYGFGAAVFYLPLLAGFVLSFFTKSYPWQLTGLLLGFLGLTSLAAALKHFTNKIPKFFWIAIGILMIGYLLVHAGIGSNRALSTYDQWNTGYLGIGIIYAMLLAGVIFSGYLVYKLLRNLYDNIIKPYGCLSRLPQKTPTLKTPEDEQKNLRDNLGRRERRETTQMKSKMMLFPNNQYTEERILNNGDNKEHILNEMNLHDHAFTQDLLLQRENSDGSTVFRAQNSGQIYNFPAWSSRMLKENMPLLIDSNEKIFAKNTRGQVGTVLQFQRQKSDDAMMQSKRKMTGELEMGNILGGEKRRSENLDDVLNIVINNNKQAKSTKLININGSPYQYKEDDEGDDFVLINYNGKAQQRLSEEQFFNLFIQNSNRLQYKGESFLLGKKQSEEEDEQFYYIQSPQTGQQYTVTKAQIIQLLNTQGSNQAGQQQFVSTSLIPSVRSISEQNAYIQFNPTSSKSINYTSQNQQYTKQYMIEGQRFRKLAEEGDNVIFQNMQTGQKVTMRKSEVDTNSDINDARIESLKAIAEGKLRAQGDRIMYQGQQYRYEKFMNDKYLLRNTRNNLPLQLTVQQLASILGLQIQIVESSQSIPRQSQQKMPSNVRKLNYIGINKQQGLYIYEIPFTSEQFQIDIGVIDVNQGVFVDQNDNIWHKGQIIGESHTQKQSELDQVIGGYQSSAQYNVQQYTGTNRTISSVQSLDGLNKNEGYNLKFVSPDFKLTSSNNMPSQKDILAFKQNIMGRDVAYQLESIKNNYPDCKVIIESIRNPSERYIVE